MKCDIVVLTKTLHVNRARHGTDCKLLCFDAYTNHKGVYVDRHGTSLSIDTIVKHSVHSRKEILLLWDIMFNKDEAALIVWKLTYCGGAR